MNYDGETRASVTGKGITLTKPPLLTWERDAVGSGSEEVDHGPTRPDGT